MRTGADRNFKLAQGFALVATLVILVGVVILLVGLISVTSSERRISRIELHRTRADLAVDSAMDVGFAKISDALAKDGALFFTLNDGDADAPSEFLFSAQSSVDGWQITPLISGGKVELEPVAEIDATELINRLETEDVKLSPLPTEVKGIWEEMPRQIEGAVRTEYAFWIEDLSGRLPLKSEEVDFSTLIDPLVSEGAVPPELIEARESLPTLASLRGVLDEEIAAKLEPSLHHHSIVEPIDVIPFGFGYSDEGLPKHDLNELVTNEDVDGIAEIIERNLPKFAERAGGFPDTENYVKTLAASIIDYADSNSDATVGLGYRGVDSYPFVNEIFDRYEWVEGSDGMIDIKVETFIELWNPSQQTVSGDVIFKNVNRHAVSIPLVGIQQFGDTTFPSQPVTLPPNGFLVLPLGEETHSFSEGSNRPSQLEFIDQSSGQETAANNFELHWNGVLVDTARGGLQRTGGILRGGNSERKWKGNASPAHDHSAGQAGDPRASYYISSKVIGNSFSTNSNWGGRSLKAGISAVADYREVRIDRWPDGGSSSIAGMPAGTDTRRPGASQIMDSRGNPYPNREYPVNEPDYAPARISNQGEFKSVVELGNIFDPAQWSDVMLTSSLADSKAGGGMTLAIGRAEFPALNRDGWRAAQLLDLFRVVSSEQKQRVNINTAPREVLRALAADLVLEADLLVPVARLKNRDELGDIFAEMVIAHRQVRPFRSLSDFARLRENPVEEDGFYFGNPENFEEIPSIEDPEVDRIDWNDAGREEFFAKLADRVCFSGRVFRMIAAGRVLDQTGKVVARSAREVHFAIDLDRDAEGAILPNGKKKVRKLYEVRR